MLNGIAYKTFVSPAPAVHQATRAALNRMGMKVTQDKKTDSGWSILATAEGRQIDIDLQWLGGRAIAQGVSQPATTRTKGHGHAR